MTTTFKDIELLLDSNSIPYNITTLGWMLKKLDNEDLDILYNMLEETYEASEGEGLYKLEQRCQEQYDKGYADGYDDGYSTEE